MLAMLNAALPGTIQTGADCTPAGQTLKLKWNMFVSEWGGYTVDGCDGVNPKLKLAAGTTYTFDQSDASNWCARVALSSRQCHQCMHQCALLSPD